MSTDVYVGTVERGATLATSGELLRLDWDRQKVQARIPAVPMDTTVDDPNLRGGVRGGRGIHVDGPLVYAGVSDGVNVYQRDLTRVDQLSNGLVVGVHEVFSERRGALWLTSTTIDAAVEIDLTTGASLRSYWPREDPRFQESLGLAPLVLDKEEDQRSRFLTMDFLADPHHLHLNALAIWRERHLALFHQKGVIADLDEGRIVVRHPALEGAHNLVVIGDTVFTLGTAAKQVCLFDLVSGELIRAIGVLDLDGIAEFTRDLQWGPPSLATRAIRKVKSDFRQPLGRPLFMRGLCVVGDELYIGISPAAILKIDWPSGKVLDIFEYSKDVRNAVHGLTLVGQ